MKLEQIFYSWMDDGDAKLNRYFIEDCLKAAIKKLNRGTDVAEYSVVRDTKGLAGMVDIARVILERIEESAVFVADVSIINPKRIRREGERPTPNPNVMFELGYAYDAKGEDAIIAVFNTAHGEIEELPFDVRPKRILTYHAAAQADLEKAKPSLVADLLGALKLCLKETEDALINKNSIVADAVNQARLLASEVVDWPNGPALIQAIEAVGTLLDNAMNQDVLAKPGQNLLSKALSAFKSARKMAPTDENWSVIKQRVESAATYVNFLARGFHADQETIDGWIEQLRRAPVELRKTLDAMEQELTNCGSMKNELVLELDDISWTVRMIALNGSDPSHPKFGEALVPLSLRLRRAGLALCGAGRLVASEIRAMCSELEALVTQYFPISND